MANISQLTITFVDGTTVINAEKMNGIVSKINEVIDKVNGSSPSPTPSYEAETTAILSRYTKSVSDTQKNALNTFVIALKNAGIYNKIHYLILPFLANDSAEALQNAMGNNVGTVNNATSVALANNAITPIIGANLATISGVTNMLSDNFHVSYCTIDTPELVSGKQDCSIGMEYITSMGKALTGSGSSIGMTMKLSDDTTANWMPSEVSSFRDMAKTHVINIGGSGKVAISVNGTYVENNSYTLKTHQGTRTLRLFLSAGASATTYVERSEATSAGKPSQYKIGLYSAGLALSETEAKAFNNAVTALMNVIFAS